MRSNYRAIKDELVHCPFNKAHLVKRSRLITHKKICPDKSNKGIVQCPYNPSHCVSIENLERHKAKCPDRVIISADLEKEMEEYIRNKNIQNNKIIKDEKDEKENIQNNICEIEGLNPKALKKKNKKTKNPAKNRKPEEKSINLENMTNKELFNFIFNDNMVIEYHSDSSQNSDDVEIEGQNINNDF